MPLLKLETTAAVSEEKRQAVKAARGQNLGWAGNTFG